MNGLTLLLMIASFFVGRWFQYLLVQSSESKWELKKK